MLKQFHKLFILTILSGLIAPGILLSDSHPAQAQTAGNPIVTQFDKGEQFGGRRGPRRPRPSPGPKDEGDGD